MTIRFKCPNPACEKALTVKDELAGRKAPCPACKKPLTIPKPNGPPPPGLDPPAKKPPTAPKKAPAPASVAQPADLEAFAAAQFAGDPPAAGKIPQEGPAAPKEARTIDFKCEYCDTELHIPLEEAGKKIQCTNPECRLLVKVPVPKVEKKDWRDVQTSGPSAARRDEPEKLAGVQGGEVKRVSLESLEEAGAIPEEVEPVTWGQRIKRLSIYVAVVGGLLLGYLGASAYFSRSAQKRALDNALAYADAKPAKLTPAFLAELHRAAGEFYLQAGQAEKARDYFYKARSHFLQGNADKLSLADKRQRDLFLVDLAANQVALGGDERAVIDKAALYWDPDVANELGRTLNLIGGVEARAAAVRAVGWKLLQKKQEGLAVALARRLASANALLLAQQVALQLAAKQTKEAEAELPEPKPKADKVGLVTRLAYAEGRALEGHYEKARDEADRKGQPLHRLEGALAVAVVALLQGKDAEAGPSVKAALKIEGELKKPKEKPTALTLCRLACLSARAGLTDEAKTIADALADSAAKARGQPELQAELKNLAASARLELLHAELKKLAKDGTAAEMKLAADLVKDKEMLSYALAVEAIARHNARLGQRGEVEAALEGLEDRFRPFAHIGMALGIQDGLK